MKKINKKNSCRTRSLGLKVEEKFYWELKELAAKEKCQIVEIIEKSVKLFKKEREKTVTNHN